MGYTVIPTSCPRCRKVLYASSRLRPQPAGPPLALVLWIVGGVLSTAVLIGGFYLVRDYFGIFIPTVVLGPLLLVPAIIPGFLIGTMANRLPKTLKLRCSSCGWAERFQTTGKKDGPVSARPRHGADPNFVGGPRTAPVAAAPTGQPATGSPLDRIVDDQEPHEELRAWIYAELLQGRSPEEVAEELKQGGWDAEEVEVLVEAGRKSTRHRRGVVRATTWSTG